MIKEENGSTIVNFSFLTPLVLFIIYCLIFFYQYGLARSAATTAAAEAARTFGIYHNQPATNALYAGAGNYYSPGWCIYNYLHQARLAGASYIQFDPNNDAILTDDGNTVTVTFTYRFPCPVPGLPKLLNRNASLWQNPVPITVRGVHVHEYEP